MLTIEHCEAVHVHVNGHSSIMSAAIAEGLRKAAGSALSARADEDMQTFSRPALGEIWPGEGGRYVGTMPASNGRAGYHLILAEEAHASIKWGPYDHTVSGADDHYDGMANTLALVADDKDHPAAAWAHDVRVDELQDYYLPAHNELMLMWICAPQLFSKQGHWSSTQYSPNDAWVQDFEHGDSTIDGKDNEFRAVAVRRLSL